MAVIVANGLLVLAPSAPFLASRAGEGTFDVLFYSVQGVELIVGGVNLRLIALNMHDGLRLRSRRQSAAS